MVYVLLSSSLCAVIRGSHANGQNRAYSGSACNGGTAPHPPFSCAACTLFKNKTQIGEFIWNTPRKGGHPNSGANVFFALCSTLLHSYCDTLRNARNSEPPKSGRSLCSTSSYRAVDELSRASASRPARTRGARAHTPVEVIRSGGVCVGYRPAVGIDIGTKTQCQYDIEYCA